MKQTFTTCSFILMLLIGLQSCNPDCETLLSTNIVVPLGPYQEGTELVITANPPEILDGREIHLSYRSAAGATTTTKITSRFEALVGGAIIEIPMGINAEATILVDDPDCTGQLIPLGSSSRVVDPTFFLDNPLFVTPTPPLIIIPSPPVSVPTNIVNAWFSPNDRNYCIWFNPVQDTLVDGTIVGLPNLIPAGSPNGQGPKKGSVELAAGCSAVPDSDSKLFHNNPVYGRVDVENNVINIRIDRTSKGLGIEHYTGQLISGDKVPTEYLEGGRCSSNGVVQPFFMYLTSVETGRQMILFHAI